MHKKCLHLPNSFFRLFIMEKRVFFTGIDTWVWCMFIFAAVVAVVCTIGASLLVALPLWGVLLLLGLLFAVGCRYEVMGDKLVVYRYMMPHRYPISKISEVAKSTGHTGTIGLSSRRVTVRFADRSVMKSSLPLQLSPRDRDGFIDALRAVNPSINVEGGIS